MVETSKKAENQGKEYRTLLTGLFKVFDCLTHDLVIVKPHAYGFSVASLILINDYVFDRKTNERLK